MKNKIIFAVFAAILVLLTVFAASADNGVPEPTTQTFYISSAPITTAIVDSSYAYQVGITFNNGVVAPVTYSLVSAPTGMSISSSGLITWMPTQSGNYFVNVSVRRTATPFETHYQAYNIVVSSTTPPAPTRMFEIYKIEADVDGNRDTLTSEGSIDEEAELGDDIEITVRVRNNFAVNNADTILRDITMDVSSDIDDADGLDDSMSRLEAGDNDKMVFSFTMDSENVDPADAPFDINIDIQGETDDGTIYTDSWTITLDMNTKSKDLYIVSAQVNPVSIKSCSDTKIRTTVNVRNIGSRDLTNAAVVFKISDLGINEVVKNIELDTGDEYDYSQYIIIPAGTAPDTYSLEIQALPTSSTGTMTDVAVFDVVVQACGSTGNTSDDEDVGNGGGVVIIPDVTVSGTPVSSAVGQRSLFDSSNALYLVLLGALVLLLLVIVILLVAKTLRD
ncbi:MAG: putative Ig domain-containing protein [Candidatus Woesearchaeota archaeon]|jgi:hypothetical protein